MTEKPMKFINPQRVHELLDCYGADATRWPEDERAAALAMIHNKSGQHKDLRDKYLDAQVLDMALGLQQGVQTNIHAAAVGVNQHIVDSILNRLPPQVPAQQGHDDTTADTASLKDSNIIALENKHRAFKHPWLQFGIAATFAIVTVTGLLYLPQHSKPQSLATASTTQNPQKAQLVAKSAASELDQWLWQEVVGETSEDDNTSDEPASLLALIELET